MHKIYDIEAVPPRLTIGRQGEANVEDIRFDCSNWIERFGEMEISVWISRPAEVAAYPAEITRDGNVIAWVVSAADAAVAGEGSVEVLGIVNDKRKLSAKIITHVLPSALGNTTDAPDGGNLWAADVLDAAERVEGAVVHPPIIGENGNWWLWDFEKSEYTDSGKPSAGAGGGSGSGALCVNLTQTASGWQSDKTPGEMVAAINGGQNCYCKRTDEFGSVIICTPVLIDSVSAVFARFSYIYDGGAEIEQVTISAQGVDIVDYTIGNAEDDGGIGGGIGGW